MSNPDTQPLAGVKALQDYLDHNGLSINAFARNHKLDASELSKLLRSERKRVNVKMADAIQTATEGVVHWRLWIPEKPEA